MGPIRRGLTLSLSAVVVWPQMAMAAVCDKERPDWDGAAFTSLDELIYLLQTPIILLMILTTALAVRFRSEWGGLVVVVGWSAICYILLGDDIKQQAMIEGCVGSPALFIAVVTILCIGVVLYTAPLPRRSK
ncbi:hypothetical protein [Yoonia sp. SS1-5]|uniref:Uncharacterized protein n=1 Tax=Yoonia rhodophyticola TaxID=3137370 RepID=A0AAN0MCG4_9RHOB